MRLIFKILNLVKYLLVIDLSIPKKNKVLAYAPSNLPGIEKIITTKYHFMSTPSDRTNIHILIKMIINFKFKKLDYLIYYIHYVSPKLIVTTYDNDIDIYKLKKKFPKIKFIVIQNGTRNKMNDIFGNEFSKPKKTKYVIDHFFVFGKAIEDEFKKFVSANYYRCGSYKNNFFKLHKGKKINKKKIIFISQFRLLSKFDLKSKENIIKQDFYNQTTKFYKELEIFCLNKKIELFILPSHIYKTNEFNEEKKYFTNLSINKKVNLIKKKHNFDSYKIFSKFDIYFATDSTLIYEALSRNKRIASLGVFKNINYPVFTWPLESTKKGYFFSNKINTNEIERIYNNITNIKSKKWFKYLDDYKKNFMCFDYDNLTLKKLIKKIINESN